MGNLAKSLRRGEPMIWLTGSALGMCMLMITGLLIVILTNGLSFFWPKALTQLKLQDGSVRCLASSWAARRSRTRDTPTI